MRYFPPLILREKYFAGIEAEIQRLFDELIYVPLFTLLRRPLEEMRNAMMALLAAVESGQVWYEDGRFHGRFNARISANLQSIGAIYDSASRTWKLPPDALPTDIRFAQAQADDRTTKLRRSLITTLDDMNIASIDNYTATKDQYKKTITWMEGDFQKAVRGISIPANLTEHQKNTIAADWGTNLDLYIKNWAAENILKLRETVQANGLAGGRAEALVKDLRENYGVSKNKAKFLARQETALLMSKFQETRYRGMGITKYKWSTSGDDRVRPSAGANPINGDHRILEGKIFSWDNPPITCARTGARNNPGEDYNCRCIAIPVEG